jgi:hypothetical protein
LKIFTNFVWSQTGTEGCATGVGNILVNRTNLVRSFSYVFIAFLYMFREIMCPSSGEKYRTYATPGICQFIWMTVWYVWYSFHPAYQRVIHIN